MTSLPGAVAERRDSASNEFDAIVIGAGLSGLRAMRMLRDELGLSVRAFEAGTDVGGTWYWNRYPGARTDSESWVYCYEFDKGLLEDFDWEERFPGQEEMLQYLGHVADRFDLRKDIRFETQVVSASYDEDGARWTVTTAVGERHTATYLVSAAGILSATQEPPFPGIPSFEGEWYQTSRWPKEPVDLAGKRVAVVGTGSTGVQVIPLIAEVAERLTVFQRTANFVVPSRNHRLDDMQRAAIKRDYDSIWAKTKQHPLGFPFDPANRVLADTPTDDERRVVLERYWEAGTFRFLTQSYDDLLIDHECNGVVAEFVRNKIRTIVEDPATAEVLCPRGYPIGSKRPPLGHHYYETYNRRNVSLVDVSENAIVDVTPRGILLANGEEHEVDVIVFAIGFDAMTGALMRLNPCGRAGQTIAEAWNRAAPQNYLALCTPGFPNMFTVLGPQSPFSNAPVTIERQVRWIREAITHLRVSELDWIEAEPDAAMAWTEECRAGLAMTVLGAGKDARSWFVGTNVDGKQQEVLIYPAGVAAYIARLEREVASGFTGFRTGRALLSV